MTSERAVFRDTSILAGLTALGLWSGSGGAAETIPSRLPEDVRPTRYTLDLEVIPEGAGFSGTVQIAVAMKAQTSRIWLHAKALRIEESYVLDARGARVGARFVAANDAGLGELLLEKPLDAGAATLVFKYAAPWGDEEGLYTVTEAGRTYAFAYLWPLSARAMFPCFDEPGIKAPFELSVTTSRGNAVIANAPDTGVELLAGGLKRVTFAPTRPLSTPLFMLGVGDLDVVSAPPLPPNELRSRAVPLRGVSGKGKGPQFKYALASTPGILDALERYFGIPYPYAKLDLIAIPRYGGGMETAAAISYSERYVLLDERSSVIQERSYAWAHAHELAHQWFGNVVTPAWFDDLWLNESFASWMGNRALQTWAPERDFGREAQRSALRSMDADSRVDARSLRLPIRTEADTVGGFSRLIYGKGEAVIAMFEGFLGAEPFRRGVRSYLERHMDGNVTAGDFFAALDEASEHGGIGPAFESFVDQPGVPLLNLDWHCSEDQVTFDLAQSRSLPLGSKLSAQATWKLPVCLAYEEGGARSRQCLLLDSQSRSVSFPARSCPATVMPNAGGNGYYRFALPAARVRALMENFGQLDAREALALEDSIAAQIAAGTLPLSEYLRWVPSIAAHPAWDVASAPIPRLLFAASHLADAAQRKTLRQLIRSLYGPRLQQIGLADDATTGASGRDERAQLRDVLVPLLAFDARDTALRRELARLGSAYIGFVGDGKLHPEKVDPTLVPAALAVAAQELGSAYATKLWEQLLQSNDVVFRRSAGAALARMTEPSMTRWFRERLLSPELSTTETPELFIQHAEVAENLPALWEWEKTHLAALARRVPGWRHGNLVRVVAGFCDAGKYREAAEVFGATGDTVQGVTRALEAAREETEICLAVVQRQRDGLQELGSVR